MEPNERRFEGLSKWIYEVSRRLERRIDWVDQRLEERIDRKFALLNERIDQLHSKR